MASSNEIRKVRIQDLLNESVESIETPSETMLKFRDAGRLLTTVKLAYDLKIFRTLAASTISMSAEHLALPFKADPLFVGRVLQFLASKRMVIETQKNHFAANMTTKRFNDPRVEAVSLRAFHIGTPLYQEWPKYVKEYKSTCGQHAGPSSADTGLDFFAWTAKYHPEFTRLSQQFMVILREDGWLDVDNFDKHVPGLMNKGGGMIKQDHGQSLNSGLPIEEVEFTAPQFYTPQPTTGLWSSFPSFFPEPKLQSSGKIGIMGD